MPSFRDTALVGRAVLAGLTACALVACSDDSGPTTNTPGPLAYVRVINAIPDTQSILYKFTDRLENPLDPNGVVFRAASAYQGHAPGQRQFRAFMLNPSASLAIAAGAPLIDQTITLRPDQYYTIVHYGRANRTVAGVASSIADSLLILEDSIPTNATLGNNIGIRVVHVASGVAGVDVFATRRASDALPGTPLIANFGYLRSSGNTYPTRVPADSIAARIRVVAAPTIVISQQAPNGEAGTDQRNPLTGARTPGAALSVFAFPAPTPTTRANAADTLPILRWFVDQRAPNTQPINRN